MRARSLAILVAVAMASATSFVDGPADAALPPAEPLPQISFEPIGRYSTGLGFENSEIAHVDKDRMFVINTTNVSMDVVNFSDPTNPTLIERVDLTSYGAGVNSVAVHSGLVAVAMEADPKTDPGFGVFFDLDGDFVSKVTLGALPDMVTFNKGGSKVLFANEGEPNDDYTVDPEGSVSIVKANAFRSAAKKNQTVPNGQSHVSTVSFADFNVGGPRHGELPAGVRIFGPGASVAQDLEPEYITAGSNGRAYVTLQEANAIAEIDIGRARVRKIHALGLKHHDEADNGLDASDRDDVVNIANPHVHGMYQPDGISMFVDDDDVYLVTANEGDTRAYDGFNEEARVSTLTLDPAAFPNAAELQEDENLGRLVVTNTSPQGPNGYTELWSFGARSFSIVKASNGQVVWDSGDEFEQITAAFDPRFFNSDNEDNNFDNRSDNKGPEPEGVDVGQIKGRQYAFVALERIGGLMIYDVTKPNAPKFVQYTTTRDFTQDPTTGATDSGPEAVQFIEKAKSPTKQPLIIVSNEISGTVNVYAVSDPDGAAKLSLLHTNDGETALLGQTSGGMAVGGASAFKSVLDRETTDARSEGNSVVSVYNGDAFLPSALLTCSLPPNPPDVPVFDAVAQRLMNFDAHAIGNHEFDIGPAFLARFIRDHTINGVLNQPFLSANVDFTPEPSFADLLDADGLIIGNTSDGKVVASSKIVIDDATGERFGIVGASPPETATISSPAPVVMKAEDIPGTAALIQTEVNRLQSKGVDKIILVSQLQGVNFDADLIALVTGLDIAVAGGGEELLNNPAIPDSTELLPGETEASVGAYPLTAVDAAGRTVYIVVTTGQYRYLGRFDATFDANGEISSVDTGDSYVRRVIPKTTASDAAGITDSVPLDAAIEEQVIAPVTECLAALNEPILRTEVVLDTGRGSSGVPGAPGNRRTETNTGNSVADAYLHAYDTLGPAAGLPPRGPANPVIAVQNGGGIRDQGGVVMPPGGVVPGTLSRKNTLDVLAFFTNRMAVITDMTPAEIKSMFERSASALPAADGRLLQVGGVEVVFTLSGTAQVLDANGVETTPGTRVVSVTLADGTPIVAGGAVVPGAPNVDVISQNFTLFQAGDGYTNLRAIEQARKLLIPQTYEQVWVDYLLTFPVEDGFPTIDSTDTRYAPGGEGRITINP